MKTWPHSGFSAFLGEPIAADDIEQRLFVARYLKKCPVSNERISLASCQGDTAVTLRTKRDGKLSVRSFTALEFLAELQQHLPDLWEQTSRAYGIYSSRSRGAAKEEAAIEIQAYAPDSSAKPSPRFAALMKRVFEIDPLLCPRCGAAMKIKAFISDPHEIERLMTNLGLPRSTSPPHIPVRIPEAA